MVIWTEPYDDPGNVNKYWTDIEGYDLQYRRGTSGSWTAGPHRPITSATITVRSEEDTYDGIYQVRVRAINAEGESDWSEPGTGSTNVGTNKAPIFEDQSAVRSFPENTMRVHDIEMPVTATDMDAEEGELRYSLEGTDADSFTIDRGHWPNQNQIR